MPPTIDRLQQAHAAVEAALAEFVAASHAVADADYSPDLPSLLVCGYEPRRKQGRFRLLGHVTHLAYALEHSLADPQNAPFRQALLEVMGERVFGRLLD